MSVNRQESFPEETRRKSVAEEPKNEYFWGEAL